MYRKFPLSAKLSYLKSRRFEVVGRGSKVEHFNTNIISSKKRGLKTGQDVKDLVWDVFMAGVGVSMPLSDWIFFKIKNCSQKWKKSVSFWVRPPNPGCLTSPLN